MENTKKTADDDFMKLTLNFISNNFQLIHLITFASQYFRTTQITRNTTNEPLTFSPLQFTYRQDCVGLLTRRYVYISWVACNQVDRCCCYQNFNTILAQIAFWLFHTQHKHALFRVSTRHTHTHKQTLISIVFRTID